MRTGGAIAFWRQFQACLNGALELQYGSRRERCRGPGMGVGPLRGRKHGRGSTTVQGKGLRLISGKVEAEGNDEIGYLHLGTHRYKD